MKVALTIAGSDSIGGAGLQADLKAFASLGIHGCSAVTCITAQNTTRVTRVDAVLAETVRAQLQAILEDMVPGAAKTGAIYTAENASVIAELFSDRRIPLVIDPVLVSTTGGKLAKEDYLAALKKKLIPICALVTPNISETERLTGIQVASVDDAAKAADQLLSIGASGALIKGIADGDRITDYLGLSDGSTEVLTSTRWPGEYHGTGCILSALTAGYVALGNDLCTSVIKARGGVFAAIEGGEALGKGTKIINPIREILIEATKHRVIESLDQARAIIEEELKTEMLPEVGSNLGFSIPSPRSEMDVAGFTGRIIREGGRPMVVGCARFGASKHVARVIVAAARRDANIRSAMNIKYDEAHLEACKRANLGISSFSRSDEPKGVSSMDWGTGAAIDEYGSVPDVIWDAGGHGKEPMIRILGREPSEVLDKVSRISSKL